MATKYFTVDALSSETDALDFAHDVADMIGQATGVRGMLQERRMP